VAAGMAVGVRALRYLWAAPNTVVGALLLPCALGPGSGIRLVDGVLEIHGPAIAWFLRTCVPLDGGAAAITLGHIVAARDERTLSATRAHERVHVRQCERWGPAFIPAYLCASLIACATGAGAYEGNYFERQARAVAVG
jgi:hypothetical protein